MMFGFFAQPHLVDEFDSLGWASGAARFYETLFAPFPAIVRVPANDQFNINAVAEPAPDTQSLISDTYITYNGNGNANVTPILPARGWRYTSNTVRASMRMRKRIFRGHDISSALMQASTYSRTSTVDVTTWRHVSRIGFGNNPGNPSVGANYPSGLVGQARNLIDFRYASSGTTQFATIAQRFSPALETIEISLGAGVGSVINDRLQDAVNLKDCWMGYVVDSTFKTPSLYGGAINSNLITDTLTGFATLNLSHCPSLRVLALGNSGLTSLTLHATPPLEVLVLLSCTGITTDLQSAINKLFASGAAVKLILQSNTLTWTRNITASDIPNGMSVVRVLNSSTSVWTGTITLSASRVSLGIFIFGNAPTSVTNPALKNNLSTVDISGLTGLTQIDLSNCRITDLTLPPAATGVTFLGIAGNKLDTTVSTTLIARIQAMTALQELYFSTQITAANNIENGQDSTNGLGAGVDFSALTVCTSLYATKCKLTGTFTAPPNVQVLILLDNNISGLNGGGTAMRQLRMSNNSANVNFASNSRHNLTALFLDNTGQTAINVGGRSITTTIALFTVTNNAALVTLTFPSTAANAVFVNDILNVTNNPLLTTFTNLTSVTHTASGDAATLFSDNALNIDFAFGSRANWNPRVITLANNGMSSANVNANINSIYTNRRNWDIVPTTLGKSLTIGGTNGAATGTEVANATYKTGTITGITQAATAVVTVSAIGTLANNDVIRIRSVNGMSQVNQQYYMIKSIAGNTFQLYNEAGTTPINSTAFTAYVSAGIAYVEGTPANEKEKIYVLENVYGWTITNN
ncbi:MAG TPA: hypothetical protein VK658_14825 [Chryseolinea sp.]|nr:hypothetical protein [Chryseolinea sp.]